MRSDRSNKRSDRSNCHCPRRQGLDQPTIGANTAGIQNGITALVTLTLLGGLDPAARRVLKGLRAVLLPLGEQALHDRGGRKLRSQGGDCSAGHGGQSELSPSGGMQEWSSPQGGTQTAQMVGALNQGLPVVGTKAEA